MLDTPDLLRHKPVVLLGPTRDVVGAVAQGRAHHGAATAQHETHAHGVPERLMAGSIGPHRGAR